MKLSEQQQIFTINIAKLINKAEDMCIGLTFGHAWRSQQEQRRLHQLGKTKTLSSRHKDRLAVDFNFFINGKLTYRKNDIQELGDFWESLHEKNKWGGNFKSFLDTPHFEMKR